MFVKIVALVLVFEFVNSVYVDTKHDTDSSGSPDADGWEYIKVYHPPKHHVWYKYGPFAYPKYEFEYAVSDKKTGDFKHHKEHRDGDRVHGEYSLVEPDGSLRKVEYKADDYHGFNAIVSKGINKHGEDAYSLYDNTRYFSSFGNGVKINQYFPDKYHQSHEYEHLKQDTVSDKPKPVVETSEDKSLKMEPAKLVVMNDMGSKMVIMGQENVIADEANKNVIKAEEEKSMKNLSDQSEKSVNAELMVPIVTMLMKGQQEAKVENEQGSGLTQMILVKNKSPETENPSDTNTSIGEPQKTDSVPDSNVASSYYHSRVYYGY